MRSARASEGCSSGDDSADHRACCRGRADRAGRPAVPQALRRGRAIRKPERGASVRRGGARARPCAGSARISPVAIGARPVTALTKFHGPRVGERGRSPRGGVSCALRSRYAAVTAAALALSACAATQDSAAVAPSAPGFLLGVWHGFIFPIAWLVSLFTD